MLLFLLICKVHATGFPDVQADNDIRTLESAIMMFRLNAKMFPPQPEGLRSLVERPAGLGPDARWVKVLDKLPSDPWGNAYGYLVGDGFEKGFGLYSRGADGKSATQGNDADDICSWRDISPGSPIRLEPWIPWSLVACTFTAFFGFECGRRVSARETSRNREVVDDKRC